MKRWMTLLMCVALATAGATTLVRAGAGPVLDWDPAYFWQPGATPTNLPAGGIMRGVGIVSSFGAPLDFLNATMPATEYTFSMDGMVSTGTVASGLPSLQFYTTSYNGGTIDVYADPAPNSVFAPFPPNAQVPSTFVDGGAPILSGTFTRFVVITNNFTAFQVGNIEGDINWTGGTLLSYFHGSTGAICPGLFTGGATWNTSAGIGIPGYLFRHDGKIDLQCPTPHAQEHVGPHEEVVPLTVRLRRRAPESPARKAGLSVFGGRRPVEYELGMRARPAQAMLDGLSSTVPGGAA